MHETSPTWAARWRALGPAPRRRIVLGSLVVVSLAARDLVLLVFAVGLFGLAEVAPTPAGRLASRAA